MDVGLDSTNISLTTDDRLHHLLCTCQILFVNSFAGLKRKAVFEKAKAFIVGSHVSRKEKGV